MLYFFDSYGFTITVILSLINNPSPLYLAPHVVYFVILTLYIGSFVYASFFATTWCYNITVIYQSLVFLLIALVSMSYTFFSNRLTLDIALYVFLLVYVLYFVFTIKYLRIFEFVFDLNVMPFGVICLLLPILLLYVVTVDDVCHFLITLEFLNVVLVYFLIFSMNLMRYEVEGVAAFVVSSAMFSVLFSYGIYISVCVGFCESLYFSTLVVFVQVWRDSLTVWPVTLVTIFSLCLGLKFGLQPASYWMITLYNSFSENQIFFYFGYFYTIFLVVLLNILSLVNLILIVTGLPFIFSTLISTSLIMSLIYFKPTNQVNLFALSTQVTAYMLILILV